jgi:hypothetical protein
LTRINFPENWPLPPEFLEELGRISVLFGVLESGVNMTISKLSGYEGILDWRSATVTAHANFKQRLDILETLLHELHDEYPKLKDYPRVVKNLKDVQGLRNKYLHNSMHYDEETDKVEFSQLSARGKLKPKMGIVTIHELQSLAAKIHNTQLDLHELITGSKYPPIWENIANKQ